MLAGVASLVGLLVVGVMILIFSHKPSAPSIAAAPAVEPALHSLTSAVTIPYLATPPVPPPPAAPAGASAPPPALAETQTAAPTKLLAPLPVAAAPVVAGTPRETVAVPETVATSAPVAPPPAPAPLAATAAWPDIDIGGTFSAGGKTLVVLRGGMTLEPGASAPNGVRLESISGSTLRLSYKDQQRTYRMSGRTYIRDPAATPP
jgi:hypothetical protein